MNKKSCRTFCKYQLHAPKQDLIFFHPQQNLASVPVRTSGTRPVAPSAVTVVIITSSISATTFFRPHLAGSCKQGDSGYKSTIKQCCLTLSVTTGKLNLQVISKEPGSVKMVESIFRISGILKCATVKEENNTRLSPKHCATLGLLDS
jgi:hypothetical protein